MEYVRGNIEVSLALFDYVQNQGITHEFQPLIHHKKILKQRFQHLGKESVRGDAEARLACFTMSNISL